MTENIDIQSLLQSLRFTALDHNKSTKKSNPSYFCIDTNELISHLTTNNYVAENSLCDIKNPTIP